MRPEALSAINEFLVEEIISLSLPFLLICLTIYEKEGGGVIGSLN